LTAKSYTEEENREIAVRLGLAGYPHLALMREALSVKAKSEPKFRFYNLKRLVVETETLKKEETMRRKLFSPVEKAVERLNLVLEGWGRYFKCGYPSRQFAKVNSCAQCRLCKFLDRKSRRQYRLKYAETYYGELQELGLIALTRRRYYR
jgi:hypothetical protein